MRKGEPVAATGILEQLFNASNLAIVGLLLNFFIGIAPGANVVIRIRRKELRFDRRVFAKIIRIGLPAGIQSAVFPRYRTPSVPQKIAGGRT